MEPGFIRVPVHHIGLAVSPKVGVGPGHHRPLKIKRIIFCYQSIYVVYVKTALIIKVATNVVYSC